MRCIGLILALFIVSPAHSEVIHLECPRSHEILDDHGWVIDLDTMEAKLSGPLSPVTTPGTHRIYSVTDKEIFIVKDIDKREFWIVDRYTLASYIFYEKSGNAFFLSERCSISKKQF